MIFPKHCKRCGDDWNAEKENPRYCPICKSPYWNKDKVRFPKEAKEKADESILREDEPAIDASQVLNLHDKPANGAASTYGDILAIPR